MERVLIGNEHATELLSVALFTGGHVLMEGVPGVAKTTIANLFSRATGMEYNRIQMTPDILPADVTGTNIYNEQTGEFTIQRGPIFTNMLLADEINRATPKTQSALLEGMQEEQVTIEGETLPLPSPFMIVATQNPIEMDGTFELPEAQRDRFQLKINVPLLDRENEEALIDRFDETPTLDPESVDSVVSTDDIRTIREQTRGVYIADSVKQYLLDVVKETRPHTDVEHGVSSRATLDLLDAVKARAAIHGREYVIPDDVKTLSHPVLAHRLVLTTDAELSDRSPREVISDIVDSIEPPGSSGDNGDPGELAGVESESTSETHRVPSGEDDD